MTDTSSEDQSWWDQAVESVEEAYDTTVETVEQAYDGATSSFVVEGNQEGPERAQTGAGAKVQAAADHAAAQAGVGVDPASPAWGDREQKWVSVVAVGEKAFNVINISFVPPGDGEIAALVDETHRHAQENARRALQEAAAVAAASAMSDTPGWGFPAPEIGELTEPVFTPLIADGDGVVVASDTDDPEYDGGFKVKTMTFQAQYQADAYLGYVTTVRAAE